jgi:hypothetical protein
LVHEGSGNVFADIGVANPEEALLKAELVRSITNAIDLRNKKVRSSSIVCLKKAKGLSWTTSDTS